MRPIYIKTLRKPKNQKLNFIVWYPQQTSTLTSLHVFSVFSLHSSFTINDSIQRKMTFFFFFTTNFFRWNKAKAVEIWLTYISDKQTKIRRVLTTKCLRKHRSRQYFFISTKCTENLINYYGFARISTIIYFKLTLSYFLSHRLT